MKSTCALLTGLLLGAPALGLAQTTEPAPLARFYVGLAAYQSPFQSIGSSYERGFPVPLQLTAGYQWRPRLAVQVGLAYRGSGTAYFYNDRDYLGNGQYGPEYEVRADRQQRGLAGSLLGRYLLTRKASHRMQFDVLGGFTLEHYRNRTRYTRTDGTGSVPDSDFDSVYTGLVLSAGPGVRYRFGPHLEATYNLLLNAYLLGDDSGYFLYHRSTASMALGLQYRFGRR